MVSQSVSQPASRPSQVRLFAPPVSYSALSSFCTRYASLSAGPISEYTVDQRPQDGRGLQDFESREGGHCLLSKCAASLAPRARRMRGGNLAK